MAWITEAAIGFPNASGMVPPENGILWEILGELGWNTYGGGKDKPAPRLLVPHDDADREFAYTAAETSLETAAAQGWTVVSVENDWATVFA